MSLSEELKYLDATALAELVRKKEVKPIELVEDVIERIEKLNPTINAVITPMYEIARDAAKAKISDGPFSGVPFLLKDAVASYGGAPMYMGSKLLRQLNYTPDHDSELVRRYKKAGLIISGKTSTPEFGLVATTEPEAFEPTRNPWNLNHSTGGSSGGSAAAVASRIVPMAHGNDGGGSIRIPASCCGVFGLKPTRARNSLAPDIGEAMGGLVCEHALTLSVRDSAALLDATAGCVIGDPYWAPPIDRPYIQEVGALAGRLRIAFSSEVTTNPPVHIHQDCARALADAVSLCKSLGHSVEEASPVIHLEEGSVDPVFVMWAVSNRSLVKTFVKYGFSKEHFEPLTWGLYELASSYEATDYFNAQQTMQRVSRSIAEFFNTFDVWLTPALAKPPIPLGSLDVTCDNPFHIFEQMSQDGTIMPICNVTGQPAMSVPLYWNEDGLPIGAHFIGRFGDEATLFRLAAQLEAARPWKDKHPPICA